MTPDPRIARTALTLVACGALAIAGVLSTTAADDSAAPRIVGVHASGEQAGNPAVHSIDADADTRWAVEGEGNWIALEFSRPAAIDRVELGFFRGDERTYHFDIEASDDGETWRRVLRGSSSGRTSEPEPHRFDPVEARHLRLVHRGNSENNWISLNTFAIPGVSADIDTRPQPITGPTGLVAEQWADESLIAAPIAIDFDHLGNAYVTQTTRRRESDVDIRDFRDWVPEEMSLQSVEDKRTLFRERFDGESPHTHRIPDLNQDGVHDWRDLTVNSEYVHRLADTTGDGRADQATLFADGFNSEVTGVAGGVLHHDDAVYLTVAPDVWKLRDTTGDGIANQRRSISHGYGVHIAYAGHGMSGLTLGPDGRVYWSVGDIGFNITTDEGKHYKYPNRGAVLRAEPDGSNVELFAKGLRNTHEFAFDKYGNMFSVDNDADLPGERERTVYIVPGGEYGWRANWQYRQSGWTDYRHDVPLYNPWMNENLWHTYSEDQPAYVIPALAHYSHGPTGMVYNPGAALNDDYRDHFFLTQFPGETLHAFRFEQQGAGFEQVDEHVVHRGILATGLAFGPDGALYMNDWISGWVVRDDGAIWRLDDPEPATGGFAVARQQTQRFLAEGMRDRDRAKLLAMLGHTDQRIRMEAQFELVRRGELDALLTTALNTPDARTLLIREARPLEDTVHSTLEMRRIHAMWGVGQILRNRDEPLDDITPLLDLLADDDAEIRAQAAQLVGDIREQRTCQRLVELLDDDDHPRVQSHAALALGRIHTPAAGSAAIALLERNDDADAFLRHAAVMALVGAENIDALLDLTEHDQASVRRAAVVALRRLDEPGVTAFLADDDPRVAIEAALAIHDDFSIPEALPTLAAALHEHPHWTDEALLRRAINANLRLGGSESAQRLAAYAARDDAPTAMRAEALATLGEWPDPHPLDRVEGRYRELPAGDAATVHAVLTAHADALLASETPADVRRMLAHVAGFVAWADAAPHLLTWLGDADEPASLRLAALQAIAAMNHADLGRAVRLAMEDADDSVRATANDLLSELDAEAAAIALAAAIDSGTRREAQRALATLADMDEPAATQIIADTFDRLTAGDLPDALALDTLEAARAHADRDSAGGGDLAEQLNAYEQRLASADDPLVPYRPQTVGGDADAGERIFMENLAAACIRCHTVGSEVAEADDDFFQGIAPDLADVGNRLTRNEMLQSLLFPNQRVAPGYGTIVVTLNNGDTLTGTLREEAENTLHIITPAGDEHEISASDIASRTPPISMMPPMQEILTPREVRNVIEYLTTLKE